MWIEWAVPAMEDMEGIYQYRREFGEGHVNDIVGHIVASTELLLSFPLSGRQGKVSDTRELVVRDCPYLIHYSVHEETIFILRVRHTSREPL